MERKVPRKEQTITKRLALYEEDIKDIQYGLLDTGFLVKGGNKEETRRA